MLEYNATWTRLKTENVWGLRITVTVKPGDTVRVYRDSTRSVSTEVVGDIVWTGPGVTLAKVGKKERKPRAKKAKAAPAPEFDESFAARREQEKADEYAADQESVMEDHMNARLNNDADLPF